MLRKPYKNQTNLYYISLLVPTERKAETSEQGLKVCFEVRQIANMFTAVGERECRKPLIMFVLAHPPCMLCKFSTAPAYPRPWTPTTCINLHVPTSSFCLHTLPRLSSFINTTLGVQNCQNMMGMSPAALNLGRPSGRRCHSND